MDRQPDTIASQAARHFARRNGASLPERRERDKWLNAAPEHREAYSALQRIWDRAGSLAEDAELQALRARDLSALRSLRWRRPQRLLAVAASILVLLVGGYVISHSMPPPAAGIYATSIGEQRTEVMSDGTRIVLNTDSALEVRYSRGQRTITLRQGEAQFEVERDTARPFVVQVGTDTVTALGTRFQVRREPASSSVILLSGAVEVARGGERYVLKPNEQAVLSERTGVAIGTIDPAISAGWLEGWLRFRSTPLAEVIAEANRYSERQLKLGDPRLAHVRLSGNFHVGDNDSIASSIGMILPVRVQPTADGIILLPK